MIRRRIPTSESVDSHDPDTKQHPTLLSEGDLELIDALQINPRADWVQVGAVLGVDPVTAGRRWQRLNDAGEAWATVALGQRQLHSMSVAFLEIDCEAGAATEVADHLVEAGHLITVQHVTGNYDLWVIAVTASPQSLAEQLLNGIPQLPGVRKVRTHMATRVFDASRRWRLHALSRHAVSAISPDGERLESTRPMDDADQRLFSALSGDGRMPYSELGELTNMSARTVQRRITRLVATGDIDFRCDLARSLAGWGASVVLWLEMPDALIETTGQALLRWPETRTCAAIAGPSNLLLTAGLHTIADLHPLVSRLSEQFPYVNIVDRQMVLRQAKLYGRVLDASGRGIRTTPVNPWAFEPHGR